MKFTEVSMFKLVDEMMKSEFEKLFNSQRSYRSSDKEAFIRGCEAAFKHQQSKVDELQANFDQHDQWLGQRNRDVQELNDIIAKHAAEKNELQKRVDAALKMISSNGGFAWRSESISQLEQVLKGGRE
jgi:CHASE3 domain sensor protein